MTVTVPAPSTLTARELRALLREPPVNEPVRCACVRREGTFLLFPGTCKRCVDGYLKG